MRNLACERHKFRGSPLPPPSPLPQARVEAAWSTGPHDETSERGDNGEPTPCYLTPVVRISPRPSAAPVFIP